MNAIRIWSVIFWGSLIISLALYAFDRSDEVTGARYKDYWTKYFEIAALDVLDQQSERTDNASPAYKWPLVITLDEKPIYWNGSFTDSSILSSVNGTEWICPDGEKWLALTSRLDSSKRWIGLIPSNKVLKDVRTEGTNLEKTTQYLEDCQLTSNSPFAKTQWWQILLLIPLLIAPWFFILKFPGKDLKTLLISVASCAIYFAALAGLSPWLVDYLGLIPEEHSTSPQATINILHTLYKSFFLFYLGQLFYRHDGWQSSGENEITPGNKVLLTGFYMLLLVGIVAGVQVLEDITCKGWLDLHFILGDTPPEMIIYGALSWLFGIGGITLIALRITRFIYSLKFPTKDRIIAMVLATAIMIPFTFLSFISISAAGLVLTGLASMLFLDLFVEEEKPSLSWILASFLLISALTTALGYNQVMKQEKNWVKTELRSWQTDGINAPGQLRSHIADWSQKDFKRYQILFRENGEEKYSRINDWLTSGNESWIEPVNASSKRVKDFEIEETNQWKITRNSLDLLQPLSLFSRIFALLIGIFSLLTLINYRWTFLPERFGLAIFAQQSLRTRIQIGILATILVSFLIIGLITQYYYVQNKRSVEFNTMETQVSQLTQLCFGVVNSATGKEKKDQIKQLENSFNARIRVFEKDQSATTKMAVPLEVLSTWSNDIPFLRPAPDVTHPRFYASEGGQHMISIEWKDRPWNTFFTSNLIGTLLSVYVFLFLLAGSIGLAIANSITWPIEILAEKIKQVRLGKQNEPLKWNNPDELGELIRVYNEMIEKLDNSAKSMVKLERDMAWREMAQQVAHEIKNPLTPMKLSIQYLMQTVGSDPERLQQLVPRVSETLLEQVDNLSTIASEFSNFGTLPKANNAKVNLNEVVASVHDLFRKRDDLEINLYVPIEDLWVFVDRNYMIRVLNNLIKNAIQAIPADRDGKIDIIMKKVDDNARIVIRDNGIGIPDDMKEKVFEPNFTTKSSGTGLGLAICASLLESFNGVIYFETEPGKGTEFYVELPLMLVENNFKHIPRVNLDD